MLVYRLCSLGEVDYILNNQTFIEIGKNKYAANTHNYLANYNYMHFFAKRFTALIRLDNVEDHYLCTYDIPSSLLKIYCGVGRYSVEKIFNRKISMDIKEYAIPSHILDFSCLKKVEVLHSNPKNWDLLWGNWDSTIIYEAQDNKCLVRKKEA